MAEVAHSRRTPSEEIRAAAETLRKNPSPTPIEDILPELFDSIADVMDECGADEYECRPVSGGESWREVRPDPNFSDEGARLDWMLALDAARDINGGKR